MKTTIVTEFAPGRVFGPDGTSTFTGQIVAGKTCGAWMRPDACCSDCGQQFRNGDRVEAALVPDWESAQWRHYHNPAVPE